VALYPANPRAPTRNLARCSARMAAHGPPWKRDSLELERDLIFTSNHHFVCENSPVASGVVDSATGNGEVSGSGRISLAACGADSVARSNGTLGRPRKGMVSEKRLADGLKEDKF
jgi:hypothetical protein